jgi:4-hydroxybenzoate polyprenyltransferase
MGEAAVVSSGKPPTILALIDLTRILYFGPAVASAFLLGVLLAMPDWPLWMPFGQIMFVGIVGFSAGFVLNDWMDREADKVTLAARGQYPEYATQLRRERPLTGTRPIAAGIIGPTSALLFALALLCRKPLNSHKRMRML